MTMSEMLWNGMRRKAQEWKKKKKTTTTEIIKSNWFVLILGIA